MTSTNDATTNEQSLTSIFDYVLVPRNIHTLHTEGNGKSEGRRLAQREAISEEKGWLFEISFSDCQVIKKLTALLLSKLSVKGHFKIRIALLIEEILNKLGWMLFFMESTRQ